MPTTAPRSRAQHLSFAAATVLGGLVLVELTAAGLERTLLAPALSVPRPDGVPPEVADLVPLDPARLERWGGSPDAVLPEAAEPPDDLTIPPGAHITLAEDPTKGWRLPAGRQGTAHGVTYRINDLGLRGPPLPPPRPDALRLLSLGDSSIYGDTVPEPAVFTEIAATHLTATWGCTVTPVNGGVPGYTSAQVAVWIEELWPAVDPDVVVVGPMWSDIYPQHRRPRTDPGLREPLRRLATYRVLRQLLAPWLSPRKVRWIADHSDVVTDDRDAAVPLPAYLANLRRIAAFAHARDATVVFLALPAPIDLDPAPVPEIITDYRAAMALVAEETDSLLVDGPAWLAREGGTLALFNDQVHPSSAGHALLGFAVAETLGPTPAPCP